MKFALHVGNVKVKNHDALSEVQKALVKRILAEQTSK